jgi:hypothetical protein
MVVEHKGMEFGYELISMVPYAYWLHLNGELSGTVSTEDTGCLYYFSPDHKETVQSRRWEYMRHSRGVIPNVNIHKSDLDWSQWEPPPYKEHYANDEFDFDLVVCNKYNREWFEDPINYLSPEMLDFIFSKHHKKKIFYFHMTADYGRDDKVESLELGEWGVVGSYDNVTPVQEMGSKYSLNELQCRIYANCDEFITVQGGGSIFASFFGGRNVIFAIQQRYDKIN